jgi:ABC-type transport system involved in cytochrome c biogenesis permease subunit
MNSVNAWFWLHIPLLSGAYLLLLAASLGSLAFIVQERLMKTNPGRAVSWRIPSLEALERFVYRTILIAFPLLTAGILSGGFWGLSARGRFWSGDPAEVFALVTWTIYSGYLLLRWSWDWHGRKSTYVAIAGFILALVALATLGFHT